jgi:uncharacterized membrane-anchored protein YitT (DUF2179 family)
MVKAYDELPWILRLILTVVPAIGGYSGNNYEMLLTTLSRVESYLLKDLICEIDPVAFTFFVTAKEVYGDGF